MKLNYQQKLSQLHHALGEMRNEDELRNEEIDELQSIINQALHKILTDALDCNSYAQLTLDRIAERVDLLAMYPNLAGIKELQRDTLIKIHDKLIN